MKKTRAKLLVVALILGAFGIAGLRSLIPTALRAQAAEGEIVALVSAQPFENRGVTYPAWSPDSRHVILQVFKPGLAGLQLVLLTITDDGFTTQTVMVDFPGTPAIAWRPDGRVVAVETGFPAEPAIRLYSVPKFREIARRSLEKPGGQIDGQRLLIARGAMAFSMDGSSLWVAASGAAQGAISTPTTITLALRLDAQDLRLLDRLDFDVPVPGARRIYGSVSGDTIIEPTPQGVRLTAIITQVSGPPRPELLAVDVSRNFVCALNLETKKNIFPPFELSIDNAAKTNRLPKNARLSANSQALLVTLGGQIFRQSPAPRIDLSKDRSFDVFDLGSGPIKVLADSLND